MSKLGLARARTLIHVRIESETERRAIASLHLKDEAYAHLFAAAPDLLEALKHARNQIQHPDQMIDAAIAKAEGRT